MDKKLNCKKFGFEWCINKNCKYFDDYNADGNCLKYEWEFIFKCNKKIMQK